MSKTMVATKKQTVKLLKYQVTTTGKSHGRLLDQEEERTIEPIPRTLALTPNFILLRRSPAIFRESDTY